MLFSQINRIMELQIICTYWGSDQLSPEEFIQRATEAGYDGIEMNIPDDRDFMKSLEKGIEKYRPVLVAQQWLPPADESVDEYRKRMTGYLNRLASLKPLFINSHTGKDYFSFEENSSLIEDCRQITSESGTRIVHETHRGRFTHHAASLIPYLERFPDLELNADYSHFCTVSESLLGDQEPILARIMKASRYIHARVGYDQSPQVSHPFAPEWEAVLQRFLTWWQKILNLAVERGETTFQVCPEFGPAPYMPAVPFTRQPISDQWDINRQMMEFLRKNLNV